MSKSARSYHSLRDELRLLNQNLEKINETLRLIVETTKGQYAGLEAEKTREAMKPLNISAVLSLPKGLRRTAMAIVKLADGTATAVSEETGRPRAVESSYLNQLVAMGYLKRKRISREIVFSLAR